MRARIIRSLAWGARGLAALMAWGARTVAALVAVGAAWHPAHGQAVMEAQERELPAWMTNWAPLRDMGMFTRTLPRAGRTTPATLLPATRVGLAWTAGNPAALAWDITDRRSAADVATGSESGAFKRPLDAAGTNERRVTVSGWRDLGKNGAVIGSTSAAQSMLDPGPESNFFTPYSTSPLVPTDTSTTALRRTHVRMDGGGGWQFGRLGLGVAFGYDTKASVSDEAAFVRRVRAVLPGARAGVAYRISEALTLGAHSTWQGGEETVNLNSVGALGLVYQLEGYRNVQGIIITTPSPYYRRVSRDVLGHTVSAAGRIGQVDWVAYGGGVRRAERLTSQFALTAFFDHWHTAGSEAGVSVQRPFGSSALLTLEGRGRQVSGQATVQGPSGTGLTTDEWRVEGSAELRIAPAEVQWVAVLSAANAYDGRIVKDSAADLRSDLRSLTPTFSAALERPVGRNVSVGGGLAHTRFVGTGNIPNAEFFGPLFQRVFAPEFDMLTAPIGVTAFHASVRWRRADGLVLWLGARTETAAAGGSQDRIWAPRGNRRASNVTFGVVLP